MSISKTNKATVTYIVDGNPLNSESNTTTFNQIVPSLKVTKTSTPLSGVKGTTISFTIEILNEDPTLVASNITLTDALVAQGFTYVPGTLKREGVTVAGSVDSGLSIGSLAAGSKATITFDAKAN